MPKPANQTGSFSGAKDHWVASPLVVGDMVYAPNADGNLYILDLSIPGDDKLIDTVQLEGRLWGQPTTDGNLIFVTSLDHKVFAVDPQKKSVAWSLELDGAVAGSALVADGKLYVGSFGATLQAIDIATHKIAWTACHPKPGSGADRFWLVKRFTSATSMETFTPSIPQMANRWRTPPNPMAPSSPARSW